MGASTSRLVLTAVTAALLSGVLFMSAWNSKQPMDYLGEADPAYNALLRGDVAGFAERCPAYCGSLVLRAPVVLAAAPGGSTSSERFVMAMLPCLIATLVLGLMIWRRAKPGTGWLVILLVAFSPIAFNAYRSGHGEELLVGALCVAALLAAGAERPKLAGALLGLAVGSKPWAVVAVAPVLLTLRTGRGQAAGIGALACALLMAPILFHVAGGGDNVTGAVAQSTGGFARPGEIWWFLGTVNPAAETPGWRVPPDWVSQWSHPLVVVGAVLLALVAWSRNRTFSTERGLLLLASVLLVRCLLDAWNVGYYEAPFLLALLAWEVRARRGLPWRTLLATIAAWVTLVKLMREPAPDVQSLLYLAWSVPLLACLVTRLVGYEGRMFTLPSAARSRAAQEESSAAGPGAIPAAA
jgi:hypothetical protein